MVITLTSFEKLDQFWLTITVTGYLISTYLSFKTWIYEFDKLASSVEVKIEKNKSF